MSLDHATNFVKQQTLTRDAFLGGRLLLSQPSGGFRAGLDSVLLGAAVGARSGALLDCGAGVGTAGLVALVHNPDVAATLVELDPDMAALAARNLADNGLAGRGRVLAVDLAGGAADLPENHFAAVIANPPYFDPGRGTAPSSARATARHMEPAALDRWARFAVRHATARAEVIFIHPAQSLFPLLDAFDGRLGALTVLPLTPRAGEPATRILVRGIKGSRAPLRLLASRPLHEADGRAFRPEFEAIFRGESRLIW